MRKEMKRWLMVSTLLINAISVVASLQVDDIDGDFVIVRHHRCNSDALNNESECSSNGVSRSSSVLTTPVLKFKDISPDTREDSFVCSEFDLSECGTKAPSDCSTRISERSPFLRSLVMRTVASRGSLKDFFDSNGNPITFDPVTPLTARTDKSPMKTSSRRCLLSEIYSPKRV